MGAGIIVNFFLITSLPYIEHAALCRRGGKGGFRRGAFGGVGRLLGGGGLRGLGRG
jgi:hypothetical protein